MQTFLHDINTLAKKHNDILADINNREAKMMRNPITDTLDDVFGCSTNKYNDRALTTLRFIISGDLENSDNIKERTAINQLQNESDTILANIMYNLKKYCSDEKVSPRILEEIFRKNNIPIYLFAVTPHPMRLSSDDYKCHINDISKPYCIHIETEHNGYDEMYIEKIKHHLYVRNCDTQQCVRQLIETNLSNLDDAGFLTLNKPGDERILYYHEI